MDWRIDGVPCRVERAEERDDVCAHGGAFWEAIGDTFQTWSEETP